MTWAKRPLFAARQRERRRATGAKASEPPVNRAAWDPRFAELDAAIASEKARSARREARRAERTQLPVLATGDRILVSETTTQLPVLATGDRSMQ